MIPTIFGILVLAIGVFLMSRALVWMLAFFIFSTLMGGASAIDLPALGGSSIQPSLLVLVLLGVKLFLSRNVKPNWVGVSLRENALLTIYCIYGAVTAFLLPKIFAHQIELAPMGAASLGARPLTFSSQNITTAFYLIGTGFAAIAASMVGQDERSPRIIVNTFIVVTWIHVLTGLADLGLSMVHQEGLLNVFRNAHYAQLDQTMSSVHRIAGITPEPSAYAAYGAVLLTLMGEFWMRGVAARHTGPAALAMLVLLVLTTSSTGYVAVGVYGFTLAFRILFIPGASSTPKAATVALLILIVVGGILGLFIFKPDVADKAFDVLRQSTVAKADSSSGEERATWARQGLEAFSVSHGLGVGAGSFRSSGLPTAVIGSTGVIGSVLLFAYLLWVTKLWRPSSYRIRLDPKRAIGAAAGWAVLMSIVTASIASPSPDPGALFAVLGGLALVWSVASNPKPTARVGGRMVAVEEAAMMFPAP